jgi:hypothetical protein
MDLATISSGVLIGNLLTVWFVWGAYHAFKRDEKDIRLTAYISILAPLGIAILSMIANGFLPVG